MAPRLPGLFTLILAITSICLAPAIHLNAGTVPALTVFDFEGPVFHDRGESIKDHSMILVDGLFHIFYITGDESYFGHATSADLRHWTVLDPILEAGPDDWDGRMIWAPHVVPFEDNPGYYLMYYTGVNSKVAQRTCLAISSGDLTKWVKAAPGLFEPLHSDTAWAAWDEGAWSNYRDPCFFFDGETEYLSQTATTKDLIGAIGLAVNTGLFHWEDAGPLYVHNNWHQLESSFVLKRGGKFHLFFTEEQVGGISWMSSDHLTEGWNIYARQIIDGGHACELLEINPDQYLFSRHTSYYAVSGEKVSSMRIDTLNWNGDTPDVSIPHGLAFDWTILWGNAFDRQPVFGNSFSYRGDPTVELGLEGNWWIGTYESFTGPITGFSPGSIQGDGPVGAIRSRTFTVVGRSMRLLVGGGDKPDSCYVTLCDARNGAVIFRETGRNSELMTERKWDLDPWRGKEVYLEIVDNSSSVFGHINVDSIEELPDPLIPVPGEIEHINPPIKRSKRPIMEGRGGGSPSPAGSISCHPNPFNPVTTIAFNSDPNTPVTVTVYSVAGRMIRSFEAVTDGSGAGTVRWDGLDGKGRSVPSGVYAGTLCSHSGIIGVCKLVILR